MPTYVIERTVPGAGQMDGQALAALSARSNEVLDGLGSEIEWDHSYVTDDKIVCVYRASDVGLVHEHARCGGFPIDAVHEVRAVIDPSTGRGRS